MRLPLFTKVLLAAALFLILGVLWSWAAAGVLSIAALLLLGAGGSGEGAASRRAGPHVSGGTAAASIAGDGAGCDSGGGFDGGGGCDGG